jgi:hypothetical protein
MSYFLSRSLIGFGILLQNTKKKARIRKWKKEIIL